MVCIPARLAPAAAARTSALLRPSATASASSVAAALFAVLRRLDDEGAEHIFSEAVDAEGVGLAVMNRLGRAAAFHVIEV